jgi:tripartite-type tricarboxylate transporter receptor subunit TctC
VPNAPGSSVDTIGRLLMAGLSKALQQPAVADNKAGAAGALGTEAARAATPDLPAGSGCWARTACPHR